MIVAIVFDLDGVLIDSEPVWEEARRGLVAERGGRWTADAQRTIMGTSTREWASYLSKDLGVGLPPDEVAALVIDRMAARCRERPPPRAFGSSRSRTPATRPTPTRSPPPAWSCRAWPDLPPTPSRPWPEERAP
jgi:hypothetical protein